MVKKIKKRVPKAEPTPESLEKGVEGELMASHEETVHRIIPGLERVEGFRVSAETCPSPRNVNEAVGDFFRTK